MRKELMNIRNIVEPSVKKLVACLSKGGHAGTVSALTVEAALLVLDAEKQIREKRKCNVPFETDLVTEQYDEQGRRRYRHAAIDDEPVMVPDKGGFWTPALDTPEPETTKLPAPSERLMALLAGHPGLANKLLEAIETERFLVTLSFQKKYKPDDPNDLQHFWLRQGYPVNDVIPSLKHIAADFAAKEMPNAEVDASGWH